MEEVLEKEKVKIGFGEPNVTRQVQIKPKIPSTTIPKELHPEVRVRIGSKWKEGTRSPLMGLSPLERKFFLPEIIGIAPESNDWNDRVKKYYANLTVVLPPEGIKLNLSTGDDGSYAVPEDYVVFKQMLADKTVANSPEEMNQTHSACIVDPERAKMLRMSLNNSIDELDRLYLKLLAKDDDKNYKKLKEINSILRLYNVNPEALTVDEKIMKLRGYKELSISSVQEGVNLVETPFYERATDDLLVDKAFVQTLVSKGAIVMQGTHFVDASDNNLIIGKNLKDAALFMRDQNNSEHIVRYRRIVNS